MKQTEVTVQVFDDENIIRKNLINQNFEVLESYTMNDYYYSKLSNLELLSKTYSDIINSSFLIRNINDDNSKTKIIFKDKTIDQNDNVISESKIACTIDNIENAKEIFNKINLNCWCEITQNITTYRKHNIEFAVQVIEGLGNFIEYEEDSSMKNLSEYEKINLMIKKLKNLGLNLGNDYSCKKVHMKFLNDNKII